MFINAHNEIQQKINKLQNYLSESELTPPLFVRFRMQKQNYIFQVSKIIADDSCGVSIYNGNPGIPIKQFAWEEMTGVEALADSKRIPFFLNDLNEQSEANLDTEGITNCA